MEKEEEEGGREKKGKNIDFCKHGLHRVSKHTLNDYYAFF